MLNLESVINIHISFKERFNDSQAKAQVADTHCLYCRRNV